MLSFARPCAPLRLLCVCIALLAGCDKPADAPAAPPAHVTVETVQPQPLTLTTELNGRLVSPRTAQVRARVAGIVLKRVYREGSDVKEGQVLFLIDPAPLQAEVDSAEAGVKKAQAMLYQTRLQAKRYAELAGIDAVSRQEAENAQASYLQAQADVAANQAALKRARLNLGYATVRAPIAGRIGKALVTEGALVGQDATTPLAIIEQLEPIYADVNQSTRQLSQLRRALQQGHVQPLAQAQINATLIQEDGEEYSLKGQLLFSDLTVEQSTGQITLRSQFPNPDKALLPGSFVRVRLDQAYDAQGITVAQRAVQRDAAGKALVLVVDSDGKVQERPIELGSAQNNRWVVKAGLAAGDRVVVEGVQHAQPGQQVAAEEVVSQVSGKEQY